MKQTLTTHDIARQLHEDEYAGWSWSGALALAEYLEEMDESCGIESEFDRVAIRCDFSEDESLVDWAKGYFSDWKNDLDIDDEFDEVEIDDIIRDYIQDHGILIEFEGGIIVSSF